MAALTISLTLSPEVAAAFQSAQADRSVRSLILTIAEERFHLDSTNAAAGDVAADFESLAATLSDSEPRFVIFCVDPDDAAASATVGRSWVLVCYVPDLSQPRDKMLYSSSRDALKKDLGAGLFAKSDFYCNEKTDLTWASYKQVGRPLLNAMYFLLQFMILFFCLKYKYVKSNLISKI